MPLPEVGLIQLPHLLKQLVLVTRHVLPGMVGDVPFFVQNEDLWKPIQFAGHHHSELPVQVVVGGEVPVALVHPADELWEVLREIGADGVEVEVGLLLPTVELLGDGVQFHAAGAAGGEPEHEHGRLAVFFKNRG